VTPAGAEKALPATVTRLGQLPDSSSGTTTYPVVVTLDGAGLDLASGGTASVDVVVGTASGVVTVPTSAVSNGAVDVLDGATVTRVRVTTGVVGRTRPEITGGLQAGQTVVLADLDQALPSGGSTTTQRRFGVGAGGFAPPSGGFGGAGRG